MIKAIFFCLLFACNLIFASDSGMGNVFVSFATNSMIPSIRYYLSPDFSSESEIRVSEMKTPYSFEEGDLIYVRYNNPSSSYYDFKGFRIYSYDENGLRTKDDPIEINNRDLITIPSNLYYDQISIEPYGTFKQRTLHLSDTVDGNEADNVWAIGDKEYTNTSVEINSTIPYSVSFKYNPQLFYVVSCNPSNRIISAGGGAVIFFEENPMSSSRQNIVTDYSVELKPYTYISFDKTNHLKKISNSAGKEIPIKDFESTPFKIGDTITIETDRDWGLSGDGVSITKSAITEDSRFFTVTVIDNTNYNIKLFITKTIEHTVNLDLTDIKEGEKNPYIEISTGANHYETFESVKEEGSFELKDGDTLYVEIQNAAPSRQKMSVIFVYEDDHQKRFDIGTAYKDEFLFSHNRATNLKQIKFDVEYGINFPAVSNDPDLIVRYYADGNEVKTGDFLADGTEIRISIQNLPSDRMIDWSDRVKSDSVKDGILEISRDVTDSDFEVATIPKQGFWFDPEDYKYDHGTVEFSVNGAKITTRRFLENGDELKYQSIANDDGYHLPAGEPIIVEGDLTEQKLHDVQFVEDEKILVLLNQPPYGGHIDYYYNEEKIEEDKILVRSGEKIDYVLLADNGYTLADNNENECSFEVSATEKEQSSPIQNDVFIELESHRPDLTIDIHDTSSGFSIVTDVVIRENNENDDKKVKFSIKNDNGEVSVAPKDAANLETESGLLGRNKYKVIVVENVATYEPIRFGIHGIQLNRNQALKITRSDTISGLESPSINSRYVRSSNTNYELEFDYSTDPNRTYEQIRLIFEIVEGLIHEVSSIQNASLSVTLNGKDLEVGQFVEPDAEIELCITPDAGYYIVGKDVENNIYRDTMSYSDYVKDISSIISEHSVHKFITVNLPGADEFGSYIYEYNNQILTDSYSVFKDGDSIDVTFTASPEYSIKRRLPVFLSKNEITEKLKITEEMNGQSVNLDMLGIKVEETEK